MAYDTQGMVAIVTGAKSLLEKPLTGLTAPSANVVIDCVVRGGHRGARKAGRPSGRPVEPNSLSADSPDDERDTYGSTSKAGPQLSSGANTRRLQKLKLLETHEQIPSVSGHPVIVPCSWLVH